MKAHACRDSHELKGVCYFTFVPGDVCFRTVVLILCLAWGSPQLLAQTPAQLVLDQPGNIPILITAPHGGTNSVPGVLTRTNPKVRYSLGSDVNTVELTDAVRVRLEALLNRRPYVVAALFKREFIDANRDADVNGDGVWDDQDLTADNLAYEDPDAREYYAYYHNRIRSYVTQIKTLSPRGALLIDIHGTSGTSASLLRGTQEGRAVGDLLNVFGQDALTGPHGIFGQLASFGYDVFPPNSVAVGTDPREAYCKGYNGGFHIQFYGMDYSNAVNAIQIEVGNHLRDEVLRPRLAEALARAIATYYTHYVDTTISLPPLAGLQAEDIPVLCGKHSEQHLGATAATADFNRDGMEDLVVGMPGGDGRVRIYFGHPLGLLSVGQVEITQADANATQEMEDRFGASLAVGDFNGDGLDDLAIGSPGESSAGTTGEGLVAVFYGTNGGMTFLLDGSLTNYVPQRLSQSHAAATGETGDHFGACLAAGDFDGDGRDDLAVGVPDEDGAETGDGMVVVFYGSPEGLLHQVGGSYEAVRFERLSQEHVGATAEANDHFGYSLTTGNFDRDSYDDLAIGVPYDDVAAVNDGWVAVFYGSNAGLITSVHGTTQAGRFERLGLTQVDRTPVSRDYFGFALTTGDFDGDMYDDLAIGVPYRDEISVSDGMVVVYYGSGNGLIQPVGETTQAVRFECLNQTHVDANSEAQDRFGYSLATGDLNIDCHDELVVGISWEDDQAIDNGLVAIFYGASSGLLQSDGGVWRANAYRRLADASLGGVNETNDRFGYSMALGDFNGDKAADLAIGVPFEDIGASIDVGSVSLFFGLAPSPPALALIPIGSVVWVSWPLECIPYQLEWNSRLQPSGWAPVSTPAIVIGDFWHAAIPTNPRQQFFRLRQE